MTIGTTEVNTTTNSSSVTTLHEIIETDYPPLAPVVDRLIDAGETVLFIARQKEGKSTLALQLAIDVSCGDAFLGRYPTTKATVLYVDYENRFQRIKQRGIDLANGRRVENLYVKAFDRISERDVGLFGPDHVRLADLVKNLQPGLLFIDPLRYALGHAPARAGNSTADEAMALSIIEQVTKLQDVNPEMTVALVHHLKKAQDSSGVKLRDNPRSWIDRVYGSQVLLAHVDAIWGLEEDANLYTFGTVPRAQDPLTLLLEKEPDSERFILSSAAFAFRTIPQRKAWDQLPQEFGWREAVATGISNNLLNSVIREARGNGLLNQDPVTKRYSKVTSAP